MRARLDDSVALTERTRSRLALAADANRGAAATVSVGGMWVGDPAPPTGYRIGELLAIPGGAVCDDGKGHACRR